MRLIAVVSGIAFLVAAALLAPPAEAREVAVCQPAPDGVQPRP